MSTICDDLRAAILQAAMQGKLTEQSEKEEISELVEKVSCKDLEEVPFTIPENWRYVRLGDVATHQNGYAFKPSDWKLNGLPIIRIQDLTNKNNTPHYTDGKGIDGKYLINTGDVLVSWSCTIDSFLYDGEKAVLNQHIFKVIFDKIEMDKEYYILAIKALLKTIDSKRHGSTMTHITKKDYDSLLMPIPPVSEQKRIVEKVDGLMARIADLEQSADALVSLKKAFPDDIKASLLQAAMQGKLTKQLPEDGSAEDLLEEIKAEKGKLISEGKIKKQKPLTPITDDEIPFSIPDNWKWVRLGEIGDWGSGATPPKTRPEYYKDGNIKWLLTGDLNNDLITDTTGRITELALEKTSVRLNPIGSVLIAMYGATIGKLGVLDVEATTNQACCACVPYDGIYNWYLFYFLMQHKAAFIGEGAGAAQPNISKEKIIATIMPLPPLAEQKRIVERLNALMQNINVVGDLIASE